ncbi:hypothetical protein SDC9_207772 [bioreactor metagenome]|uniref:Uncharacterized protein n=1 Tax=bioreactor metagenome TaxID=1076179 RepID=A0A645JBB4_9ZZZZ
MIAVYSVNQLGFPCSQQTRYAYHLPRLHLQRHITEGLRCTEMTNLQQSLTKHLVLRWIHILQFTAYDHLHQLLLVDVFYIPTVDELAITENRITITALKDFIQPVGYVDDADSSFLQQVDDAENILDTLLL